MKVKVTVEFEIEVPDGAESDVVEGIDLAFDYDTVRVHDSHGKELPLRAEIVCHETTCVEW